jgi:hypothetical protein
MLAKTFRLAVLVPGFGLLTTPASFAQHEEAARPAIHTIDAPGAGTAAGQGTTAIVVSSAGRVMGSYIDSKGVYHGFLRSRTGAITTFDVPQAGTGPGQGTAPQSMNERGEVTGWYVDNSGSAHGFLRSPEGAFVSFDAPATGSGSCGAGGICASGTNGASINADGVISGQFVDTEGVWHGLVRFPDGSMQTFDTPGGGTQAGQGTYVTFTDGINPRGAIVGAYADAGGIFHGFVYPDGNFATFDPAGSFFTNNSGITPNGTVTSFYEDANLVLHGYIRAPDGTFSYFDISGGGTGPSQGTEPLNINAHSDITGAYIDANGVYHGFLRYADGANAKFDAPRAGTGSGQGTIPYYNNPADAICGFYVDANGVSHGPSADISKRLPSLNTRITLPSGDHADIAQASPHRCDPAHSSPIGSHLEYLPISIEVNDRIARRGECTSKVGSRRQLHKRTSIDWNIPESHK